MKNEHHDEHGRHRPGIDTLEVAAILVWSSPRDWCLDLQVILDLLLSNGGRIGTRSGKNGNKSLPNRGYLQDGQPKLFFCNPDLEWSTSHHHPRFAQGAFREALNGIWAHRTAGEAELSYTILGKPTAATYKYGEKVLQAYHQHINSTIDENGDIKLANHIKTVYMVGDNPESDIKGANGYRSRFGSDWKSILVESGVYVAGDDPAHKPTKVTKDVKDAVDLALKEEGIFLDTEFYRLET